MEENKKSQKSEPDYKAKFEVTFLERKGIQAQQVEKGLSRARRSLFNHLNSNYHNCGGLIDHSNGDDSFNYLTPDSIAINVDSKYWHDRQVTGLKVGLVSFVKETDEVEKELKKICLDAVFEKGFKLR